MNKGASPESIELAGYFPGAVGRITELHAVYYHENWGFDVSFETQVGRELSDFVRNFEEKRDGFWTVFVGGTFAGAVAVDGTLAAREGARLRWFIVDPEFQGYGLGSLLLGRAVEFCSNAGYRKVFLWTFKGLNRARLLYERAGFRLREEQRAKQWGGEIVEQKFELELRGKL